MFQLLRRVSSVFLPRPDRPWSDDATSNAPTIGHKRRHSVTEEGDDGSASPTKRTKRDPAQPDTGRDSPSGDENPGADAVSPAEVREVKEVTKGVKEVDLQDQDTLEDASSTRPEGVPLPDSPSGSEEPESESEDTESTEPVEVEASRDQEHADVEGSDGRDSLASSAPENMAEQEAEFEAEAFSAIADTSADKTAPAPEITIAVRPSLLDTPETLEVKA